MCLRYPLLPMVLYVQDCAPPLSGQVFAHVLEYYYAMFLFTPVFFVLATVVLKAIPRMREYKRVVKGNYGI